MCRRMHFKNLAAALGVILWVGILGPEIFVRSGTGCMLDENGEAVSAEEARDFMEKYFYGSTGSGEEIRVKYKLAVMEFLKD